MFEIMLYPFLALLGISLLSGAYGCQMVWHRVACLGDALSHGALLGLAIGALAGLNENVALLILSVSWAFFLWILTKNKQNTLDTIMAFLMQASMSLAIVLFSLSGNGQGQSSLMHAFLGDVLIISPKELFHILMLDIVLGIVLIFCWKKWVLIAISPDLAKAQKISLNQFQFIFFVSVGFFVAIALKFMGALLAPAFFIIPALAARPISKTPEKMALFATLIAIISSVVGLWLSFRLDLPVGASVVVVCLTFYILVVFSVFIKNILIKKNPY